MANRLIFMTGGTFTRARLEGKTQETVRAIAEHVLAFSDALRLTAVDILGFSLGGMVAQEAALQRRPSGQARPLCPIDGIVLSTRHD
jgi:pimeloyl-ACP methyl ester carboxylesterase